MPRDHAYELMRGALETVLPCLEAMARTAKNAAGRKQLLTQIEQVKQAHLQAAHDVLTAAVLGIEHMTEIPSGSRQKTSRHT